MLVDATSAKTNNVSSTIRNPFKQEDDYKLINEKLRIVLPRTFQTNINILIADVSILFSNMERIDLSRCTTTTNGFTRNHFEYIKLNINVNHLITYSF